MVLDSMPAGQPWLFAPLLWRTALRQAEALNLEWRDLQFAGTQPSVTVRNGKGGRFRVVPAHPELVDAFRSVPHRSAADKVFTGRGGKSLSPRTAARWIAEGITKAGLQAVATGTGVKGPASHSLRHSCARHWLQSGLNVNAVSAWLGHSSPTITLNTYLVLAPDTLGDISPNPPMDGARIAEGGEEVTDATVRARIRVDWRLAGGLQSVGAIGGADSGLRWLW